MGQSDSNLSPDREAFLPSNLDGRPFNDGSQQRRNFKHPIAALFHIVFKTLALLLYLFGGLFGQDFISTFVSVILLISMDFWVVKNVTGRLLAGLRWSNYIDDEGNSHWRFENRRTILSANKIDDEDDQKADDTADSSIFWTGLIFAPFMWTLLMFTSIFRLNVQWFMLVLLALVLSLSNLYGYVRCRLGTSDLKSSITQFVAKQVFLSYLTGGSGSGSRATNRPTA